MSFFSSDKNEEMLLNNALKIKDSENREEQNEQLEDSPSVIADIIGEHNNEEGPDERVL